MSNLPASKSISPLAIDFALNPELIKSFNVRLIVNKHKTT
ncbi:hypothetical protein [uncultured Gammaproteobacteria bacterium]|nr:hypothetical protein [uncultured Gammaproteobacteria bacterium]